MMIRYLRMFCTLFGCLVWLGSSVALADQARWQQLRQHYFSDARIQGGEAVIALDAPARAHDAAVVPITVTVNDRTRQIRDLYLFVDQNPLPLAGIFHFTEAAGFWHALDTRIRINEYTTVRAVAVLGDGTLHMSERFVKASGGCSAPALSDMDAAMARAGRMKLLFAEVGEDVDTPYSEAVIKISHPNSSGMQFDQLSRNYIPAFYVNRISADLDGVPILDIETNFSMSENPTVRLTFEPGQEPRALNVVALDSKGNEYRHSVTANDS